MKTHDGWGEEGRVVMSVQTHDGWGEEGRVVMSGQVECPMQTHDG